MDAVCCSSDVAQNSQYGKIVLRSAVLPPGMKVRMVDHYLEFIDADGNIVRLAAKSLLKGECHDCLQTIYVETRMGTMTCPHCHGRVIWQWGKAQLSFVPAQEEKFTSFPSVLLDEDGNNGSD